MTAETDSGEGEQTKARIPVARPAKARLETHKRDGETWGAFFERLASLLDGNEYVTESEVRRIVTEEVGRE